MLFVDNICRYIGVISGGFNTYFGGGGGGLNQINDAILSFY